MKPWKKKLGIVLVLAAVAGLAIFGVIWSRRGQVTVETGRVVRRNLTAVVTASGQIEPENYANVSANAVGKITDIYVKEGDQVKKGQLVMRTQDVQEQADVDAQKAALKAAESTLASDESSVASYLAAIRSSRADIKQSEAQMVQAKQDYARGLQLLKEGLLAKSDFDQRYSTYKVDLATLQSSHAKLSQAEAQYQQARNTQNMARAMVTQSRAQLMVATDARNLTIYTSPYSGIITDLPVHVGENVVPGVQNTAGSVLFQVSDLSAIDANIMVDETDIATIKMSQPAYVTVDALPNQTFKGAVTEIGQSALSSTTGETTTGQSQDSTTTEEAKQFKVVVRLEDPPSVLRPGLSTTARIITAVRNNAVSIPIESLTVRSKKLLEAQKNSGNGRVLAAETENSASVDGGGSGMNPDADDEQGVFAIRNGRAVFVPVETGIMGNMNVEVVKGLQPGEEIITGSYSVLRTIKNGVKVRIDNSKKGMPGEEASGS